MPRLRLYQQIIIFFVTIVLIPLLGISLVIYNINQEALKKELGRFTEHTAEALYKDFSTEMSWQRQQSLSLSRFLVDEMRESHSLERTAGQLFRLSEDLDAVGLYDEHGKPIQIIYRDFADLSPELRLPEDLGPDPLKQPFQVVYFNTGNPKDSPYYLRSILPVSGIRPESFPLVYLPNGQPASTRNARYYVQQKSFPYLQNLVRSQSLYDAFYIVDNDGYIIAGPSGAAQQRRISEQDYREFREVRPGVSHEFSSAQTAKGPKNGEELPELKKVIVKMPEINWGIIIESPYHVKQKYVKRAGTQTLILIAACVTIIILLAVIYVLGINRNFRQLIKGIQALGEGNYFRRIRLITNIFTPFEIMYLTLEFNRMSKRTADSWAAIQEANRQLAKMDEFKSNLIDTVSHELRTPLTSIKGYTSRLLRYDSTLDHDTRIKSLKIVKQQADRLSRLVEDLLVIPDLESAGLRVYPDQVELMPLIDSSIQFIQAKDNRDVTLDMRADEALSVLADPDRMEQVLLNLLDNAVKYSPEGSPIHVMVEPPFAKGDSPPMVAVTVSNACDPIPMEQLENLDSLFDKFKRLDDSLVRTTRGSGLGLFITKGLVEAMGGEIQLAYEDGRFKVRFTVPLYTEGENSVPAETEAALEGAG